MTGYLLPGKPHTVRVHISTLPSPFFAFLLPLLTAILTNYYPFDSNYYYHPFQPTTTAQHLDTPINLHHIHKLRRRPEVRKLVTWSTNPTYPVINQPLGVIIHAPLHLLHPYPSSNPNLPALEPPFPSNLPIIPHSKPLDHSTTPSPDKACHFCNQLASDRLRRPLPASAVSDSASMLGGCT